MTSIGIDLIEVKRIEETITRYGNRFLARVFTERELEYCRGQAHQLAARFAAKEAVSKALGVGIQHADGVAWREIEIVSGERGKPAVQLTGQAAQRAGAIGLHIFALSLSHTREHAIAMVIANDWRSSLMSFQVAEKTYKDLKSQHDTGKLNDVAFEAEVAKLRFQDEQGRWWQIGVQTGEWYVHDGQKWSKAKPPAPPAPKAELGKPPEKPATPVAPAPKPIAEKKAEPAPKTETPSKESRASAIPRLFSPKPAGREGGLPRRVLIAIIAAVAIVGALILIVAYLFFSGTLGGTAKPNVTPTRVVAALPTLPPPTLAPLPTLAPTLAPLPTFAPVVTATLPITATSAVTRTRVVFTPTPTKKPGTPAPITSPTPKVAPGIYVTKLETIPAKPNVGDLVGFKITILNTTGTWQAYKWIAKVYQCPDQCQDYKHSYGETLRADITIPTGTTEFTSSQNVSLGTGISCNLNAVPYWIDPTSGQPVPFQTTQGGALYLAFSPCR